MKKSKEMIKIMVFTIPGFLEVCPWNMFNRDFKDVNEKLEDNKYFYSCGYIEDKNSIIDEVICYLQSLKDE